MRLRTGAGGLLALTAIGLAAALRQQPNAELRLEAEISRMPEAHALRRLDTATEPLGPHLGFRHAQLAAAAGETDRAEGILAQLAEQEGTTDRIEGARADLARRAGDTARTVRHLAAAQNLAPTSERRQDLGGLHRRQSDTASERALLAAADPNELTPFEAVRLAELHAAAGAAEDYARLLAIRAGLGQADAGPAALLLTLALSTRGQMQRLSDEARKWLVRPDRAALLGAMARALKAVNQPGTGIARDLLAGGDGYHRFLLIAFADAELHGAAQAVLSNWLSSRPALEPTDWMALTLYAERSGDLSLMRRALKEAAPGSVPGGVFLPFLRYQGAAALLPYHAFLDPETLVAAPMVGAGWAAWQRRPEAALGYLLLSASPDASAQDRELWRRTAEQLRGTGAYGQLIARRAADPALQSMFSE